MKQYHIALPDGTREGPYPENYVREQYERGHYPAGTLVWASGMPQWAPISSLTGLAGGSSLVIDSAAAPAADLPANNPAFNNPFSALWHAMTHISLTGRACRKEYWMAILGYVIISFVIGMVAGVFMAMNMPEATPEEMDAALMPLNLLMNLFGLIVFLPLAVRRLHDTGRSGWWLLLFALLSFILIGFILAIVFYCMDGQRGTNKYGPDPKGR